MAEKHAGRAATAYQIAQLMNHAYLKAATMNNAVSGFAKCGIWPCNRNIFKETDFISLGNTQDACPEVGIIGYAPGGHQDQTDSLRGHQDQHNSPRSHQDQPDGPRGYQDQTNCPRSNHYQPESPRGHQDLTNSPQSHQYQPDSPKGHQVERDGSGDQNINLDGVRLAVAQVK